MCEQNARHAQRLLQDICRYQCDGYLCDTVIVTDDGRLLAHSIILAAASPVFKAAMKITDRPTEHIIVLPGVKSSVMKAVLQYIYTGENIPFPKDIDISAVLSVMLDLQLLYTR